MWATARRKKSEDGGKYQKPIDLFYVNGHSLYMRSGRSSVCIDYNGIKVVG